VRARSPAARAQAPGRSRRTWGWWLFLITLVAFSVRLAYVLIFKHPLVLPFAVDTFQFHRGANALAKGHGFTTQFGFLEPRQTAMHPPGYLLALALPSKLGLDSVLDHQIWSSVIGCLTVVTIAFVGRMLAGPRAGLVAAAIAAVYPNLWLYDGELLSETLVLLTVAAAVLTAYRLLRRPTIPAALTLGVALGATALTRAESVLLLPLIALPCLFVLRSACLRRRVALVGVVCAATLLTITPWIAFNLSRFERPEFLSTGAGLALSWSNCDKTYFGERLGYLAVCGFARGSDESVMDYDLRRRALDYVWAHRSRVPLVVLAREGRTWGLFRPAQQVRFYQTEQDLLRDAWASWTSLVSYYVLAVASIFGWVLLRRRRIPTFPLLAPVCSVIVTVAITLGQFRYRAAAEVALVVLSAVALDNLGRAKRSNVEVGLAPVELTRTRPGRTGSASSGTSV
jgi:4-amino-4-deoxy-L-arabinose transferase-like glycosyltransferase